MPPDKPKRKPVRVRPFNTPRKVVEQIGPLLEQDLTVPKIAVKLGLAKTTVYRIARKLKLIPESAGAEWIQPRKLLANAELHGAVTAAASSITLVDETSPPAERKSRVNGEAKAIESVLDVLDRAIFPGVAGTEPRGSRRTRLDKWRDALGSCEHSPESIYTALVAIDAALAKGQDGRKVYAAVQSWCAGIQK